MKRFVRNIAASFADRPGELDLLYVNYEQEHSIAVQRGMQRLFLGPVRRSLADTRADQLIMTNQPDGEYTSDDYEDCSIWRWMGN